MTATTSTTEAGAANGSSQEKEEEKPKEGSEEPAAVEVASEENEAPSSSSASPPPAKVAKLMNQYPTAPPEEWPEAWLMVPEDQVQDPGLPSKRDPNIPVTVSELQTIGIQYWKMHDVAKYPYPTMAVPWDPKDALDPKLQALRDDRGYSYADIITIHPDHLPEFEKKIAMFLKEHIHDAEEIRFILGGSGYFDVRNFEDEWVRIHVKAGDLITLPEGIYHRFTCDPNKLIHAMRLFIGQPIWTPFNRPQDDHPSRQIYIEQYQQQQQQMTTTTTRKTTAETLCQKEQEELEEHPPTSIISTTNEASSENSEA